MERISVPNNICHVFVDENVTDASCMSGMLVRYYIWKLDICGTGHHYPNSFYDKVKDITNGHLHDNWSDGKATQATVITIMSIATDLTTIAKQAIIITTAINL